MRLLKSVALVLGLSGGLAVAQSVPQQPPVAARLLFLSVTGEEQDNLFILADGKQVPVRAPKNHLPPPVNYAGPALLALYRSQGDGIARPTPGPVPPQAVGGVQPGAPAAPVPLATAMLPTGGGEFLVLIGGTAAAPRLALRDFSPGAVPEGGYLFWNLTKRNVGVVLGESKAMIGSGNQITLRPPGAVDGYMGLYVYDEAAGAARQLFAARHYHVATTRQLVFLTDTEGADNRVRVKIITQRLAPERTADVAKSAVSR